MRKLTGKQEQVYRYILDFIEEHGYSPSVREIGESLGLRSPSTVHFHLKGLQAAGLIQHAEGKTRAITITNAARAKRGKVPVLGAVAAGTPILAQECIEEYIDFDLCGQEEIHFALRVSGESMLYAGILPGDLVVVRQQQIAQDGEIVVARFADEATVKTLRRKDGRVWLWPENPAYEPIDGTEAEIVGKVVAVIRRY